MRQNTPKQLDKLDEELLSILNSKPRDKKDIERIVSLIEQGATPNALSKNGDSALFFAVSIEDLDICQKLIGLGADVNITHSTPIGASPSIISMAANYCNYEIVELLIKSGAVLDSTPEFPHNNPLNLAAYEMNPRIVELLIASGANVNNVDIHGDTPLMDAVRFNKEMLDDKGYDNKQYIEMIELLLSHGANPGFINNKGISILETDNITKVAKQLIKSKINEIESLYSKERESDILNSFNLNR